MEFVHLHLHTRYSVLDGMVQFDSLVEALHRHKQQAVAITDHGNMFGVFGFWKACRAASIKPIIGCELYMVADRRERTQKHTRYHQLLLAMNEQGYRNLSTLCSLGFLEGYHVKPCVDKQLIARYSEGLLATTSCLQGEIPQAILNGNLETAERLLCWWMEVFEGRFYIELQRHGLSEQDVVNIHLLQMAEKYSLPVVATNDVHYLHREDASAHEVLLCIRTGKTLRDKKRLRFATREFYLKSSEQMAELFRDVPQAVKNTLAIAEQIENIDLNRPLVLPRVPIPEGFTSEQEYLEQLVWESAKFRYGDPLPETIRERIRYELDTIGRMQFASYFLLVRDIVEEARKIGCMVGVGRGSAAGSVVAYCLGITGVDPIKYNLLFERFLNPERISMPDIDIDFDDKTRDQLIDRIMEKYGRENVAHIITFGTLAAKQAIRDAGRVLGMSVSEVEKLVSLIPEKPLTISLKEAVEQVSHLSNKAKDPSTQAGRCLQIALQIEGSVRQVGMHAAGIVIAPRPLIELVPVAIHKETGKTITQWEHIYLEEAGLLKMDLLGLATLSIIRETLQLIEERHNKQINLSDIDLADKKTLQLYQRGETVGTFQFESEGMRHWLKKLKPTHFEDLVAMVALFRPGPMDYIPEYIERKHQRKPITYPHPALEPILRDTYGIIVYQEQLMQVAQKLAGFSPGRADILRKAVAKKQVELLAALKDQFIQGAINNGVDREIAEKIFADIEKFGYYGFNRSHAVSYAMLAFYTGYLKAHYPTEYMTALLRASASKPDKLVKYLAECRRMKIKVLPPDINRSGESFTITEEGVILFGLYAIKNVGEAVVPAIIKERTAGGKFKDIYDLCVRLAAHLNKRVLEALAISGALDTFGKPREWYFAEVVSARHAGTLIETVLRWAQKSVRTQQQHPTSPSLFSASTNDASAPPSFHITHQPQWSLKHLLGKEYEALGVFVSYDPLRPYRSIIKNFRAKSIAEFSELEGNLTAEKATLWIAGVITEIENFATRTGEIMTRIKVEDNTSSYTFLLTREDHSRWQTLIKLWEPLLIKVTCTNTPTRTRTQIQEIYSLEEKLKNCQRLILKIDSTRLSELQAHKIHEIVKKWKGPTPLTVVLSANDTTCRLDASYTVSPSADLLAQLENAAPCLQAEVVIS